MATSKVKVQGAKYKKTIDMNRKIGQKQFKILEKKHGKKKR